MSTYRPSAAQTVPLDIHVNGDAKRIAAPATISTLLADLGLEEDLVAVELDRRIVPREQWRSTTLVAEASLEIVQFVGGG